MMETNSVVFFNSNKYELPPQIQAPIIVGWKLGTPENYGNILRLADTIGCAKVIFVKNEYQISERKIKKTAGDSFFRIQIEYISEENLSDSIPDVYEWVALETAQNSENIYQTNLPVLMALFVGNEKKGIPTEILLRFNKIVHIPLTGNCTSLNVSHATAVALFEWVRQNIQLVI